MKRVFVSLPDGVWKIINRDFKNKMGESESEIIRNITIAYLSQHGYFINSKGYEDTAEIHDQVDVLQKMFYSMLNLLEEKGSITYHEWENKMKKAIHEQDR